MGSNSVLLKALLAALMLWFAGAVVLHLITNERVERSQLRPAAAHKQVFSDSLDMRIEKKLLPALPVPPELVPGYNFALAAHGAKASGGKHPELLIDGNETVYTGGDGFADHPWNATPRQSFQVELKRPSEIDCIRFLLWDLDERFYRYKLEISNDPAGKVWTLITDKSGPDDACRGWQILRFPALTTKFIRLTGTYNSANSGFHVIELEACIFPPTGFQKVEKLPVRPGAPQVDDNYVF